MTDMAGATLNVIVFESEDAARSAFGAGTHRTQTALDASRNADVYEVLAHF
jgi:hypothetical protein